DNFPNWVLDQLGIETELANRIALGRGLKPPRFRWVPFDDALMLPLDKAILANETPDRKFFYAREEMLLKRYLRDLNVSALPDTLEEYTAKIVTPTLERQKQNGAVAIKFEAAYLRTLDFGNIPLHPALVQNQAAALYGIFVHGEAPSRA